METGVTTTPRRDELTIAASGAVLLDTANAMPTLTFSPVAQAQRLEICLNEVLANVLAYGGSAALAAPIGLQLEVLWAAECGEASLTVSDSGFAFNPLAVKMPPRPPSLAEARAGGLGLVMIRRCSDWLDYRREGGHNHFTFGARWKRA